MIISGDHFFLFLTSTCCFHCVLIFQKIGSKKLGLVTELDQITAEPHTHANNNYYYLSLERSKALVCFFNSEMTQTGMQSMQKFCNNVII